MNDDWSSRRLHFVGAGGAGMSGLALVSQALGAQVTGSDRADSPYAQRLREHGIEPTIGHAAGNVPAGAEVVYSTAIAADNPERRAARGRELHRAELLGEITRLRRCIAVTGTHGKTTTAAMIVHALRGAGLDPSYLVGGELGDTGVNAAWGTGEWVVVEADESDRSLLKLDPDVAVLTNAELDHHATYASRLDLEATLSEFMHGAEHAVVWDRPALRALCPAGAVAYDAPSPVLGPGGSRFPWHGIDVLLGVPGAHNAVNAAGALEASALAGADPAVAAATLADFRGARRRFERMGDTASGAVVYDDYAHHPTEVAAMVALARTLAPTRVVAVFQPHLYSRTRALAGRFGAALAGADLAVVLDVYPARERAEDFPGVSGRLIAAAAADSGGRLAWMPDFAAAEHFLRATLRAGDLCLVMGAGNVDALARALVAAGGGRDGAASPD
ncbi:MAG TPA: Mur ligase domain-containing protein [Solirubrobacteraceae bacterium]|jgi:UDP-N-acetylmuramate--alanine ligase|nr:Mur ligase domain-containing protein [Solirubrobacteraceae bacterium]